MFRDDRMENNAPDRITERKMDPQGDSPMSGEFGARRTEGKRIGVSAYRRMGPAENVAICRRVLTRRKGASTSSLCGLDAATRRYETGSVAYAPP
jgi:hypothetical protein